MADNIFLTSFCKDDLQYSLEVLRPSLRQGNLVLPACNALELAA
jgi:hypothetical protein